MNSSRFLRNKDIIDQDKLDEVTLIGLGSIGSAIVIQLAIMGYKHIILYDHDILEEHNLSCSMYPEEYRGVEKVFAAKMVAKSFNQSIKITAYPVKFTEETKATPVTIVCTDDMESRLCAYRQWKQLDNRKVFIDARMSALSLQVHTATKEHDEYEQRWYPSSEAQRDPCTAKHTIFTASLAAGNVVKNLFSYLGGFGFWLYEAHSLSPLSLRTESFFMEE